MPSSYPWIPGIFAKMGRTVALPTGWKMPFTTLYREDWLVK